MGIWNIQKRIATQLFGWAAVSIAVGSWLQFGRDNFWRGVGIQFIAWGTINGMISFLGATASQTRMRKNQNPINKQIEELERRNLLRLLRLNAVLDLFYILVGVMLLKFPRVQPTGRGHGVGVIIQGTFLFFFDLLHSFRLLKD